MITHKEIKDRFEFVNLIEGVLRDAGATRDSIARNEPLARAKREYRKMLKDYSDYAHGVTVIGDQYESWKELLTVEYNGTKADLIEELEEAADAMGREVDGCGYDCTGKTFMTGWKVGHIAGNRYKVLVSMARDI